MIFGRSALLLAEEEPRPGSGPAPTLNLLMVVPIVREKAVKIKTAILRIVQVYLSFTQFLGTSEN